MTITFPSNCREIINEIRGVIGRDVIFNTIVLSECTASGCSLNPITQTSTNPFCPNCSGSYFLETYSGVSISGHCSWKPAEKLSWLPGGQQFDGDVRIQIEYNTDNLSVLEDTDHIIVDGRKVEIKQTTYRGFKDLNRILVDCIVVEDV